TEEVAAPQPSAAAAAVTIEQVAEIWPAVLETINPDQPMVCAALARAQPVEMRAGILVVAFPEDDSFNRRMVADNADARTVVGMALESLLGARVRIEYELRDLGTAPEAQTLAGDELVDKLLETFDAEEIVAAPAAVSEAPDDVDGDEQPDFDDDGDPGPDGP
ncbi:MAG: hypothetical protein NTZ58_02990, partial [Solirubrobacterales bacterium]|nr:hypothetical protein [Solirubrobacterales bacterium]